MDRTIRGLLAGMLAAIPMNIWNLFSYYILHLTDSRLLDWGSFVFLGNRPQNAAEVIIGQAVQILWCGFLGIIFSHLIPATSSRNILIKGLFYGFITSFFIDAVLILLQIPFFGNPTTGRSISQAISATIWGAALAYSLVYINRKIPNKSK